MHFAETKDQQPFCEPYICVVLSPCRTNGKLSEIKPLQLTFCKWGSLQVFSEDALSACGSFLPKNYRHLISSAEKKPCCPAQTFLLGCNSHNKNEHGFLKITLNNLKGNTSTCNLYVSPFTRPTHYCSVNFT